MRIGIIGANAAGISAAIQAKRRRPESEVVAFERGHWADYDAGGIPYNLADEARMMDDLVELWPDQLEALGIDLRLRCEVRAIDADARSLRCLDVAHGKEWEERFDRLVIATGACPIEPPIAGLRNRGVFLIRGLGAGIALKRYLEEHEVRRALVVGGGCMGLQMAESLRQRKLEVTLIERVEHVLPRFALPIADLVAGELEHHGVRVITSAVVRAIRPSHGDARLEVATEREEHPADVVVLATGIRPDTALAQSAGLRLGDSGAIAVDAHLETSASGVFAAGDCAETFHRVTGRPAWIPLQTTAHNQGQVAGENAAGGHEAFAGVVGTVGFKAFEVEVARTGLDAHELHRHPIEVQPVLSVHLNHAHSFGHARRIATMLYVDRHSGRLLGAQMAGAPSVAKRIDVLATCITRGMTVEEISQLDLSYAPPFSPVSDPIVAAARSARQELTETPHHHAPRPGG